MILRRGLGLLGMVVGLGAGLLTTMPPAQAAVACTWAQQDLASFPGAWSSAVLGGDGTGRRFAGYAYTSDLQERAVMWRDRILTDLGSPTGGSALAYDVNSAGVAAGVAFTATGDQQAYLWNAAGAAVPLATPAGLTNSGAVSIGDDGVIVGTGFSFGGDGTHGLVWSAGAPGTVYDLGTGAGGGITLTAAAGSGVVVGSTSTVDGSSVPARGSRTRVSMLPLPGGVTGAYTRGATGRYTVGIADAAPYAPVLWTDRSPRLLATTTPGTTVYDVTATGIAVGGSSAGPIVWTSPTAAATALPLLPGHTAGGVRAAGNGTTVAGFSLLPTYTSTAATWTCG